MSRREKKTVLYSRNGIKIERTDFIDINKSNNMSNMGLCVRSELTSKIDNGKKILIKGSPARTDIIKKESPLGFYYYQTRHHHATEDRIIEDSASFVKYVVKYGTSKYEFEYPIKFNDTKIGVETRPWDILPGYKGIPDHFIVALHNEINKMLTVWEDQKIRKLNKARSYSIYTGWHDEEISNDANWIYEERKKIFIDIFGDPKGPSTNYNDLKIEAHGFDTKVSFRKRKEE